MKAAIASETGVQLRDVPQPLPQRNEVLVRVRAAGLNRADLNAARGSGIATSAALGRPIGLEWAGEIVETGPDVHDFRPGDRVMCSGSGGYAEYAVADAGRTMAMPNGMDFAEAGILPLALLTMHDALMTNARLKPGDGVLIQGASSGVGLMGLQIARLKGAAPVIGTSTNAMRRERLAAFGAELALDTRDPSWPDAVLAATEGRGVDLIIDMVSASVADQNMKAAAIRGRIVNVGRLGGAKGEFDYDLHAMKRLDYIGVTFRTRSIEEVREITRLMQADLWDAVAAGELRLPIDRSFPLADAAAAHAHMRANAHFGKIVLIP
jgi:NADPH2:quinone reductase